MTTIRTCARRLDEALIAPNAARGERLLGYGAAVFGAILAGAFAFSAGLGMWTSIVLVIVGFDMFGGVVVNATVSGSRRFHAPDTPRWNVLGFVTYHVHLLLLALLVQEMPWTTAVVGYVGLVLATVLVTLTPAPLKQPVAFLCAAGLIAATTAVFPPAPVVAWVAPLLIVKLLLAHLLPHGAVADEYEPATSSGIP